MDSRLYPNHWFFGGAFDAPDPNTPGDHRLWEMNLIKAMKIQYPE